MIQCVISPTVYMFDPNSEIIRLTVGVVSTIASPGKTLLGRELLDS